MRSKPSVVEKAVRHALSGKGAHVEAARALEGLEWKTAGARPEGVPHSIFQLVNHMVYWLDWIVKWLDGRQPKIPKHAAGSWPGPERPTRAREWEAAVRRFQKCLEVLDRRSGEIDLLAKRGQWTGLEMLQSIALHNSYHLGQVCVLRQMLGAWPPPSGGVTW